MVEAAALLLLRKKAQAFIVAPFAGITNIVAGVVASIAGYFYSINAPHVYWMMGI